MLFAQRAVKAPSSWGLLHTAAACSLPAMPLQIWQSLLPPGSVCGVVRDHPHPPPHRVKSVMVREWMVELTTASSDLNDDRRWEEEYCAAADRWPHSEMLYEGVNSHLNGTNDTPREWKTLSSRGVGSVHATSAS